MAASDGSDPAPVSGRVAISVIVPTLDRPAQLSACLGTLAAQDYPRDRFEVIVVDDGSNPPAVVAAEPFAANLSLRLLRQPNAGPSAARNAGAAAAKGRYLAFTDDDCLPEPGWLTALERTLADGADVMVGGRTVNLLQEDIFASASQLIIDMVYAHYNSDRLSARFFTTNNLAIPAKAFHSLGGFDQSFRTSEDRDLCDRWLASGRRMTYAPEAVIRHSHHLTLAGFWRQHMGYGRGAWRYLAAHRRRTSRSTLSFDFYLSLLRRVPAELAAYPPRRSLVLAWLLAVWQAANAAGFLAEALRGDVGRR